MDMFQQQSQFTQQPLAARMRPKSLEEFVGQQHVLGRGKLLRRLIEADRITSLILYGPPGTGKTSLTYLIADRTSAQMAHLDAPSSGLADLRRILRDARERRALRKQRTILAIDEIHRFNRAQQDSLLSDVEEGNVILIGTTTYNPFFSIIPPLLSRSRIFEFTPLAPDDLAHLIERSLVDTGRGYGSIRVELTDEAKDYIISESAGDGRRALDGLEVAVLSTPAKNGVVTVDLRVAAESLQAKLQSYSLDDHYDITSAFIKSMRGSDPDAAIYWLARMLAAGEDPRFIARRVCICASEDVGNADPMALNVAASAMTVSEFIGMPEAQLVLSQAVLYVATAPKSNACMKAITRARQDVDAGIILPVPPYLKEAGYSGARRLHRGAGYRYPHDDPRGYVEQKYVPEERVYYEPTERGFERLVRRRMKSIRDSRAESSGD
jgi:putative ATPase